MFPFRKRVQDIEILVGTAKLHSGGTRHKIDKAIIHEKFGYPPFSHDIALVRLQTPIQFSANAQPIKYSPNEVPVGANMQATGWGLLYVACRLHLLENLINSNEPTD